MASRPKNVHVLHQKYTLQHQWNLFRGKLGEAGAQAQPWLPLASPSLPPAVLIRSIRQSDSCFLSFSNLSPPFEQQLQSDQMDSPSCRQEQELKQLPYASHLGKCSQQQVLGRQAAVPGLG